MDLSLWDPPEDQDYFMSPEHNHEEPLLYDFCFGYGRDVIEEDALNERSCLQVLNILLDKADEEKTALEDDILMHHCQLARYNEGYSVPHSVALIEKIDNLNTSMLNLENGNTKDVHYSDLELEQPVEQPQSLDDHLKPLLELSVKRLQTDRGVTQMPILPNGGFNKDKSEVVPSKDNEKIEEKECCTTMPIANKRKSPFLELEVDSMKQGSKSPRKVRKASVRKHANAIDKNMPSVKMKGKMRKFPETGRTHSLEFKEGEDERRIEMKMNLVHQRREIKTLHTIPVKSMEREGQEMESSSLSTQNVNVQQTYGLVEVKIETQQQPNGAPTTTSLPEKVTKSFPSSENMKKKCRRELPIKLEKEEYDTSYSNRTTEETRESVGPCTNNGRGLLLNELRTICKKQHVKGYTKLNKAELIKLLGQKAPHLL